MTDTDLWATAREYDEQWPADTSNETVLMARLALSEREGARRQIVWRDDQHDRRRIAEAERDAARAEVADLRSALEHTETNLRAAVNRKPVRDMTENLAENDAALGDADTLAEEDEPEVCKCGHKAWAEHSGILQAPSGCDRCLCTLNEEQAAAGVTPSWATKPHRADRIEGATDE